MANAGSSSRRPEESSHRCNRISRSDCSMQLIRVRRRVGTGLPAVQPTQQHATGSRRSSPGLAASCRERSQPTPPITQPRAPLALDCLGDAGTRARSRSSSLRFEPCRRIMAKSPSQTASFVRNSPRGAMISGFCDTVGNPRCTLQEVERRPGAASGSHTSLRARRASSSSSCRQLVDRRQSGCPDHSVRHVTGQRDWRSLPSANSTSRTSRHLLRPRRARSESVSFREPVLFFTTATHAVVLGLST